MNFGTLRLLGVTVSLALAACGGSGGQSNTANDTSPIKLGVITSLSGAYQPLGVANKAGIDIAVDEVNSGGGVNGRKLEVSYEDDRTDPAQAVIAFNKYTGEKVTAVLGPLLSDSVLALKQGPLQTKKLPVVSLAASDAIVDPVNPDLFMTAAKASVIADRLVRYMKDQKLTKLGLWYASDNAFATDGYQATRSLAAKSGITIADDESFSARDTKDFSPLFTKLRSSESQALLVWVTGGPAVAVTKAYKNLGLTLPLMFSHAQATPLYFGANATGPASEGVIVAAQIGVMGQSLPDNVGAKKLAQRLAQRYAQSNSGYPPQFAFDGYIGIQLLVDAMKRKGTSTSQILAGLDSMNLQTPQGTYRMSKSDHSGISVDYVEIGVVRANRLVPTDYANRQLTRLK